MDERACTSASGRQPSARTSSTAPAADASTPSSSSACGSLSVDSSISLPWLAVSSSARLRVVTTTWPVSASGASSVQRTWSALSSTTSLVPRKSRRNALRSLMAWAVSVLTPSSAATAMQLSCSVSTPTHTLRLYSSWLRSR